MSKTEIYDLMITAYLSNPLFKRFEKILVNTINSSFKQNSEQLLKRKFPSKTEGKLQDKWKKLDFKNGELVKHFRKEVHKSWERNIHILRPERIYLTKVDEAVDLLINNEIAYKEWTKKALKATQEY